MLSFKSTQQLSDVLDRLANARGDKDVEGELLRMAQCLATWEKMLEEEDEEMRYKALYSDLEGMAAERTQRLEEIIGLQY